MCLGGCLGLQQRTPCIAVFVSRRGAEHRDIHRYRSYVTIRMDNTRQSRQRGRSDSPTLRSLRLCVRLKSFSVKLNYLLYGQTQVFAGVPKYQIYLDISEVQPIFNLQSKLKLVQTDENVYKTS